MTAARGFLASGVHCGLRRSRLDLALVRSDRRATGAAMFTSNRAQAAPVRLSRGHLELADPQAVVLNSGNANAATGARGAEDARSTAAATARLLDLEPEEVLVLSTGVIGEALPIDRLLGGLPGAAGSLSPAGGDAAAEAILTTDTCRKQALAEGGGFTVGGMAKGSGMIHPQLATMLAVVTTDFPLERGEARSFLAPAVHASFNSISVDGECSTNDTVVLLANGAAKVRRGAEADQAFATALAGVCESLAAQIVADGEGATLVAEIAVTGAASAAEAKAIARRVATSPLVKTALFGRDANWGRVVAAAGSAPFEDGFAHLELERLTVRYNGTTVLERGVPQAADAEGAAAEYRIELDLGLGEGCGRYLTSDLSHDYVRINADYRS